MECAYYFVDGTWDVPTYFDFYGWHIRHLTAAMQGRLC